MISLEIKKVAVIGSGLMGHGIAEVFALSGFEVKIEDAFPEALEKAKVSIGKSIEKLVKSGRILQYSYGSLSDFLCKIISLIKS